MFIVVRMAFARLLTSDDLCVPVMWEVPDLKDYTGKKGSSEGGGSCSKALMLNASTE